MILLRIENDLGKGFRGNENMHFMFNNIFFFENRDVCEIMWKDMVRPDRPLVTM